MIGIAPVPQWTVAQLVAGLQRDSQYRAIADELTRRARDAAVREEIRAEIRRQTATRQQAVEGTSVAAWQHAQRRRLFAALTEWAREVNGFPAGVPPSVRSRVLSSNPARPEAIFYFRALLELERLDAAAPEIHRLQRQAVDELARACGRVAILFPPQILSMLVRLHREMLFDLGESKRTYEDARALGLDQPPRRPPGSAPRGRARARPRPPDPMRAIRWLTPAAAPAGGGRPSQALIDGARRAWRARRNTFLLPMLQNVPPQEGAPQDLQLHTARPLVDHLPEEMRGALRGTPSTSPRPQDRRAAEEQLDALMVLIAKHATADENTGSPVRAPELQWRSLVHLASGMTAHFERSGIGVSHATIGTYPHHGPHANDVNIDRGVTIRVAAPDLLHVPQALLGNEPGAPREGWFRHTGAQSRAFVDTSEWQQFFTYLVSGFFDPHPGAWAARWLQWVNAIAATEGHPVQVQARTLLAEIPRRRGMQFLQYVRLLRDPGAWRAFTGQFPARHSDVARFLDGFFIPDAVPAASPADRSRTSEARAGLGDAVRSWLRENPPPDVASLFSAVVIHPQAQWQRLIDALFGNAGAPHHVHSWFAAAQRNVDLADLGVVATSGAVMRAVTRATGAFLASPPAAFLDQYANYLEAALPLPRNTAAPAGPPLASTPYQPPPDLPANVRPEDLSGLHVRLAHRYDRCDTTPAVSLWVVLDYIHLERADPVPSQETLSGRRLGVSGLSGNAGSPHLHLEIVVKAESSDAPPVAYLSFFDFFFAEAPTAPVSNAMPPRTSAATR